MIIEIISVFNHILIVETLKKKDNDPGDGDPLEFDWRVFQYKKYYDKASTTTIEYIFNFIIIKWR